MTAPTTNRSPSSSRSQIRCLASFPDGAAVALKSKDSGLALPADIVGDSVEACRYHGHVLTLTCLRLEAAPRPGEAVATQHQ
jgi:hypothetical protein